MSFPEFDYCVVCEGIRPELACKVTLNGFYGLAPNVRILVANLAQPLSLAFAVGFAEASAQQANEAHQGSFKIIAPNGNVVVETQANPIKMLAGRAVQIAIGFVLPLSGEGTYIFRMMLDANTRRDSQFTIRQATPEELNQAGLPRPA
jgi:hypothetical protein